jgi:hypothetical protein
MDDLRTAHVTKLDGRTVASAHNPGDGRHILRKFFAMHPKGPCVVLNHHEAGTGPSGALLERIQAKRCKTSIAIYMQCLWGHR